MTTGSIQETCGHFILTGTQSTTKGGQKFERSADDVAWIIIFGRSQEG
jgi:hypothetical protein